MTRFEGALAALFTACIAFQLFVPPTVGLANNGDYSKMLGRFSLGQVDPKNPDEQLFYEQRWRYDPAYHWVSDNYSSELLLIAPALAVGRLFNPKIFDLRILGAIHAAIWIACFMAALPLFRRFAGLGRYALPILALFIFTDVSYVAYFNSFHTDTLAFLSLAWAIVIALRMAAGDWKGWVPYLGLLLASLLFITAKPQHSLLGILLLPVVVGSALAFRSRRAKTVGLILACSLPVAAIVTLEHVPEGERRVEMFNSIFTKLLPRSPAPATDLRELGLSPDLQKFIGHFADEPAQPAKQPEVRDALTPEAHFRLAMFDLKHPVRTFQIVYSDLASWTAVRRRPTFLGNYTRESGLPPKTLARSFFWWSALRGFIFTVAPWHVLVWYIAFAGTAAWALWQHRGDPGFLWVALVLSAQGMVALVFATLGDIGETDRHLWLFHVITDITIFMAAGWLFPLRIRKV